jgi:hypothetical protein
MKVIKDHLCNHFCDCDGRGELCASSEDEAQNEGVYAASNPPTNGFSNGSRMGVSGANNLGFMFVPICSEWPPTYDHPLGRCAALRCTARVAKHVHLQPNWSQASRMPHATPGSIAAAGRYCSPLIFHITTGRGLISR